MPYQTSIGHGILHSVRVWNSLSSALDATTASHWTRSGGRSTLIFTVVMNTIRQRRSVCAQERIQKALLGAGRGEGWGGEWGSRCRGRNTEGVEVRNDKGGERQRRRQVETLNRSLCNRLGSLGSVVNSPAESVAEPRPETDFSAFHESQNASR